MRSACAAHPSCPSKTHRNQLSEIPCSLISKWFINSSKNKQKGTISLFIAYIIIERVVPCIWYRIFYPGFEIVETPIPQVKGLVCKSKGFIILESYQESVYGEPREVIETYSLQRWIQNGPGSITRHYGNGDSDNGRLAVSGPFFLGLCTIPLKIH